MEQFEQIRRDYEAGKTIRQLAKQHGVHRRMVLQALDDALPPERRKPLSSTRVCPKELPPMERSVSTPLL